MSEFGNPRITKGIRKCVRFYNPCDTSKKGKHVKVKRCAEYR